MKDEPAERVIVPEVPEVEVPPVAMVTSPVLPVVEAPEETMTAPELPDPEEPEFKETMPVVKVDATFGASPEAIPTLPEPPTEPETGPVDTEKAPDGVGEEVGEPPVVKEIVPGIAPEPDAIDTVPPVPEAALPALRLTFPPVLVDRLLAPAERLMLPDEPGLAPVDKNNEPEEEVDRTVPAPKPVARVILPDEPAETALAVETVTAPVAVVVGVGLAPPTIETAPGVEPAPALMMRAPPTEDVLVEPEPALSVKAPPRILPLPAAIVIWPPVPDVDEPAATETEPPELRAEFVVPALTTMEPELLVVEEPVRMLMLPVARASPEDNEIEPEAPEVDVPDCMDTEPET